MLTGLEQVEGEVVRSFGVVLPHSTERLLQVSMFAYCVIAFLGTAAVAKTKEIKLCEGYKNETILTLTVTPDFLTSASVPQLSLDPLCNRLR
jgi:hypothetical protein